MFNSLEQHLTIIKNEPSTTTTMGFSEQPLPGLGKSNNSTGLERVPSFQFQCKQLSVTWPKCVESSCLELQQFILDQLSHWQPEYIRVCREKHKDGATHFHAAIYLGKRCRTRDCRILDYRGCHPNIQPTRNFDAWNTYCAKDGDFLDWGAIPNAAVNGRRNGCRSSHQPLDADAISNFARGCKSRVEWLIWASLNKIAYAKDIWDDLHKPQDLNTIKEGTISGGRLDYRFEQLILEVSWVMEKCLIIVGESGIGKTTYATNIAPKPCLLVSHIDDLRKFLPNYHKSILFDDVCFNHYPVQSQIHLVDFYHPRSIHIRYAVATIPAGTHKIFTCNENPIDLSHPAIARRCQIIKCHQSDLTRYN